MIYLECFVEWLNKWQTLITGVMALVAAYFALKPVKRQLALMRTQNNVMFRDAISDMIVRSDAHRGDVFEVMSKRMTELNNTMSYYEYHERDYKFDDWCGEQHSEFLTAEWELKNVFARSHDVDAIEARKSELLLALRSFCDVLWDAHAPTYGEHHEDEFSWTPEEWQERVKRSREVVGGNEIDEHVSAVSIALRQLTEAFADQRSSLVRRLRTIDDSLLA